MNRTYVLIGASRGIGFATARVLAEAGHRVITFSRTTGEDGLPPGVEHYPYDVLSEDFPAHLLPPAVHGVAYFPGSINLKGFSTIRPEQFRDEFEINCIGAVKTVQACLRALKAAAADSPGILLFSTVAVTTGMPFHAGIAAAKGAVEGLTRALAAELAPAIRVNCIALSLTDTPLAERLLQTEEKREAAAARHPLKRIGQPADAAALAAFLLGPEAGWVTGQIIHLDGGMGSLKS